LVQGAVSFIFALQLEILKLAQNYYDRRDEMLNDYVTYGSSSPSTRLPTSLTAITKLVPSVLFRFEITGDEQFWEAI
jgi:hypothetical protein